MAIQIIIVLGPVIIQRRVNVAVQMRQSVPRGQLLKCPCGFPDFDRGGALSGG